MSMETAVAMAYIMGRTLVLPPAQGMYLLNKVGSVRHNGEKVKERTQWILLFLSFYMIGSKGTEKQIFVRRFLSLWVVGNGTCWY